MASNCTARPSACVGSGTSRTPRRMRRSDSTVRSMRERSTPARSTQTRIQFSQRYALIAGCHVREAKRENCKRASSEVTSWSVPCSQRNLMLRIGSIATESPPRASVFNRSRHHRFSAAPRRAASTRVCPFNRDFLSPRMPSETLRQEPYPPNVNTAGDYFFFAGLLFNSTRTRSIGPVPTFSGRCAPALLHIVWPALPASSSLLPSG